MSETVSFFATAAELLDAIASQMMESRANEAVLDIADAIKAVGSDVILHRVGNIGGFGGHLKGERDKFVRELREMKRGLLQDKIDSVMVAEIDECVEFVGKVTDAHSICSLAGPLLSTDEVEKVNRWLWTNREEEKTQAILDCPGLRELVAKLEQECEKGKLDDESRIMFDLARIRSAVETKPVLSRTEYAIGVKIALTASPPPPAVDEIIPEDGKRQSLDLDAQILGLVVAAVGTSSPQTTLRGDELTTMGSVSRETSASNIPSPYKRVLTASLVKGKSGSGSSKPGVEEDDGFPEPPSDTPRNGNDAESGESASVSEDANDGDDALSGKRPGTLRPSEPLVGDGMTVPGLDMVPPLSPKEHVEDDGLHGRRAGTLREPAALSSNGGEHVLTLRDTGPLRGPESQHGVIDEGLGGKRNSTLREVAPLTATSDAEAIRRPVNPSGRRSVSASLPQAVSPRPTAATSPRPPAGNSATSPRTQLQQQALPPALTMVQTHFVMSPRRSRNNSSASSDARLCLEVRVKKVFSVLEEVKSVKKESSKVSREKKKMQKLLKDQGIETSEEQQKLVKQKTAEGAPLKGSLSPVKVKDTEALLFVRVHLGDHLQRQSNFVLASSEEATEVDVLRLPLTNGNTASIRLVLMGSSGVFGKGECSVLGMVLFDSPLEFCSQAKGAVLRSGRHTFELTGSMAPFVPSTPNVTFSKAPSWRKLLSDQIAPLTKILEPLLRVGISNLPVPPQWFGYSALDKIRLQADVENLSLAHISELCTNVMKQDYRPTEAKAWKNVAGFTLVHLAALVGNADCVQHLLKGGNRQAFVLEAPVNVGANCFHLAVLSGSGPTLSALLNAAVDMDAVVNKTFWVNRMPLLHLCAMLDRYDCMVEVLNRSTGSLNARDLIGFTALTWACWSGSLRCVELLLEYDASVTTDDDSHNTVLHMAAGRGWDLIVARLLKAAAASKLLVAANTHNDTPLSLATASNSTECVRRLVRLGESWAVAEAVPSAATGGGGGTGGGTGKSPGRTTTGGVVDEWNIHARVMGTFNVNQKEGVHQNTALHLAVMDLDDKDLPAMIEALNCTGKLDVSAANAHGLTARHMACALGKLQALQALSAMGGGNAWGEKDNFQNTILHFALSDEVVDWLFQHVPAGDLKLGAKNHLGWTPLHLVFSCGTSAAVSALLAHDCDPSELNKSGRSAFETPKATLFFPVVDEDPFDDKMGGLQFYPEAEDGHHKDARPRSTDTKDMRNSLTNILSKRSSLTLKKDSKLTSLLLTLASKKF